MNRLNPTPAVEHWASLFRSFAKKCERFFASIATTNHFCPAKDLVHDLRLLHSLIVPRASSRAISLQFTAPGATAIENTRHFVRAFSLAPRAGEARTLSSV